MCKPLHQQGVPDALYRTPSPHIRQAEVDAGDLRRLAPGNPLPSTCELGAGSTWGPPARGVTEAGERSTRLPEEHALDSKPRVCTRTGEGVSEGSGAGPGGHSSGLSSNGRVTTRSGRVPVPPAISGSQATKSKRKRSALCGLDPCGSTSGWVNPVGGRCGDCGETHAVDDLLCAACHRPPADGSRWKHLGPELLQRAIVWAEEGLVAAGLPAKVVASFVPPSACLCQRSDCFYSSFRKIRSKFDRRECVPCGATKTTVWKRAGIRAEQLQLFFQGDGASRTDGGMRRTKEAINTESSICHPCTAAFYQHLRSNKRRLTAEELLAAPAGPQPPRGSARVNAAVKRHVYEYLKAGKPVCHEDLEKLIVVERRANDVSDVTPDHMRKMAVGMLKHMSESVHNVSLREYGNGRFGEDSRKNFVYLIPSKGTEDMIVALDRKVRKIEKDNEDLRRQLGRGVRDW